MKRPRHFRTTLSLGLAVASFVACSALSSFDDLEPSESYDASAEKRESSADDDMAREEDSQAPPLSDSALASDSGSDSTDADADLDALALGSDANVDAAPYCDSLNPKPTFCNDFEGTGDASWTLETSPFTASSAAISTEQASSPTNSAKLVVNTVSNSSGSSDYILVLGASNRVISSFDLYIASVPSLPLNLTSMKFPVPGFGDRYVSITMNASGKLTVFQSQDAARGPDGGVSFTTIGGSISASLGSWMRIVLDVTTGAAPTVTASLNGVVFVNGQSLAPALASPSVKVKSGVSYLTPEAGTFTCYVDNVVIDLK